MYKMRTGRVPITPLINAEMDQIALGKGIQSLLQKHYEMERYEDGLKQYIADRIPRSQGCWRFVLRRILDYLQRIDEIQDRQIIQVLSNSKNIVFISRSENEILKPFDIQQPKKSLPQLYLFDRFAKEGFYERRNS